MKSIKSKLQRGLGFMVFACLMCLCLSAVFAVEGSAVTDWENDILRGTGYGIPQKDAENPGQARIWAHQAAMMDAYRRLGEAANGIHITADSTISRNISTGDIVSGQVDAVIKRAKVISEDYDQWGNCTVVLEVPLYGVTNSIAKVALKPVAADAFPEPTTEVSASGGYTGLVVDCSGLGLTPNMSPVIQDADGRNIYGYDQLDSGMVVAKGMASFAKGMKGNLNRAGSNPLVVKATSLTHNNSYPVISADDADKILAENGASHFLDECKVVLVQ